jgi:hypothetical protein
MPRRKPKNLDAMRFELGTYERQLLKDQLLISGIRSAAIPLSAGLLGLGIAMGGFLAYNKVDDLKEWVSDAWEDGFGLVNDPAQTQEQVSEYVSDRVSNPELKGMSTFEIYRLHYDMRSDLMNFFARLWCESNGLEWNGPNDATFREQEWAVSKLGTPIQGEATFRFERGEVIQVAGADVNEISEYVYQMIIRETDSRNTQARVISGVQGAISSGIGLAFSEATHWALRSSGFMRGTDGWDGQNWEQAPGANRDPLLNYAWARTDFKTGKWWSTVDSQGDVSFWLDVASGGQGTARIPGVKISDYPNMMSDGTADYEQIIWNAHQEMTDNNYGPFLQYLSNWSGWTWVFNAMNAGRPGLLPELTPEEAEAIAEEGRQQQEEQTPGGDDQMPGEEPDPRNDPTKEEYWRSRNQQPPPGWRPS